MPRNDSTAPIDLIALNINDEPDSRQFVLRVGEHRAESEQAGVGDGDVARGSR